MRNATTLETRQVVLSKHEREFSNAWTTDEINELRLGMIVSALDDIRDNRKSKKMQQEAREWLVSNDSISPFSFQNCCYFLGLDSERLRELTDQLTHGGLYL
jgi:hypothetical protein